MKNEIEQNSIPEPNTGCWLWTGAGRNYGTLKGKAAHRASYEAFNGEIPKGLHVLHNCDCKPCVNPGHLRLGTNKENIADWLSRGKGGYGVSYRPKRNHIEMRAARRARIEHELELKKKREAKHNFPMGKSVVIAEF